MSSKKKLMIAGAGVAAVAVVALVIVLPIVLTSSDDENDDTPSEAVLQRIDCFPEAAGGVEVADEESCEARGCVWDPDSTAQDSPSCFVPQDSGFGFRRTSGPTDTAFGQQWTLEPINSRAIYDDNFQEVTFDVEFRREHLLRFKVRSSKTCVLIKISIF